MMRIVRIILQAYPPNANSIFEGLGLGLVMGSLCVIALICGGPCTMWFAALLFGFVFATQQMFEWRPIPNKNFALTCAIGLIVASAIWWPISRTFAEIHGAVTKLFIVPMILYCLSTFAGNVYSKRHLASESDDYLAD